MNRALSVRCAAVLVVCAACADTTSPKIQSPLLGGWITAREDLHPTGSMTRYISFAEDGTFLFATNMYGIYGGSELASYTRTTGTYRIEGDRLINTATRVATWDSFYGAGSPETVQNVNYSFLDQARFRIVGSVLILDYITYPADAPEPTTMLLESVRGD